MNIILYSISEDEAGKKLQRPIEMPVQGKYDQTHSGGH